MLRRWTARRAYKRQTILIETWGATPAELERLFVAVADIAHRQPYDVSVGTP